MPDQLFDTHFSVTNQVYEASAPGRMDVMGGIADYSGSMVLQMPIRQQTHVSLALRHDNQFTIKSIHSGGQVSEYTIAYPALLVNGKEVDYSFARKQFSQTGEAKWAAYIIGCFLVLHKEKNIQVTGADVLVQSDVPLGKGVSSSAALEVATMKAIAKAYQFSLAGTELPRLAQKVENAVVGAPCGLMDQLACSFGEIGKLLPILCQPDLVYAPISIPDHIYFVGIDSGIRHSVGEFSYSQVRTAAFMGYTMIARQSGVTDTQIAQATQGGSKTQLPFNGYIANISPAIFEDKYAPRLPYRMHGKYFKQHYTVHPDPETEVKEDDFYAVLDCSRHPVYENFRVGTFMLLLEYLSVSTNISIRKQCLEQLGELMYQSHTSYSVCGLGNVYTDEIVEQVRQHRGQGVFGAKITGGGSGGTVCILCEGEQGLHTARKIHQAYQQKHNKEVLFFEAN